MFKTKIILDEDKIKREGISLIECKTKFAGIILEANLKKEESNLYVMKEGADALGVRLVLLNRFRIFDLLQYIKEWKNYDDEESMDGSLEESDMLAVCAKRGFLNG